MSKSQHRNPGKEERKRANRAERRPEHRDKYAATAGPTAGTVDRRLLERLAAHFNGAEAGR
ncbi:MAG: hypothetical protein J2P22_04055 [Nocardioides sp.]|nr:hypothetical protein [Nocardioides sp.]